METTNQTASWTPRAGARAFDSGIGKNVTIYRLTGKGRFATVKVWGGRSGDELITLTGVRIERLSAPKSTEPSEFRRGESQLWDREEVR